MTTGEMVTLLLGSTTISTILVALVTAWVKRGDRKLDEAGEIRKELREQNEQLLKRIEVIEKDLDLWRSRFFTLQELYATEKLAHGVESSALKREIDVLRVEKEADGAKIVRMQAEIDALKSQVKVLQSHRK